MKKLLKADLHKTKAYLDNHCRQLERARFKYFYANGEKEKVLEELKVYQNSDGGFGNGIEPDFWTPVSSPMATWAAGQILFEIDADKNEPMVQQMIDYLIEHYNRETGKWLSVIPEINDAPHAPWWHWEEGAEENWSFNPSIELAAFLIHWSEPESIAATIGWDSIKQAVSYLMEQKEMDKHEINNFQAFVTIIESHQSLLETETGHSYQIILNKVEELAFHCINKDTSSWDSGYVPLPLDFIDSPDNPLCERLGNLLEKNLDFYIEKMSEEGVWNISWEWGMFPEAFEKASIYWQGILAVERYKKLEAFGRLEFK
ncbi:hypothetical protein [Ornithinibacillus halotolerans]|uniref:Uncharacterized protein n=1 Tax=Ornithinibacillus halotolerans TaxID=1274357 RepID=A0A916RVC5_9BACI|nr:hypothetical protein [Ornithinibacillus halotolerans]GGA68167.1 hypothetical protein GCM10008025_10120 [Ornithinibacillus halotolerans]